MIVGQPGLTVLPVVVGEHAVGRRMPRVGPQDLLGPLEPFVFVPVFHHPLGDLETRIEVARVFEHRVPELNDLVVLFAQPCCLLELLPRLVSIAGELERLGVRVANFVVERLDLAQELEPLARLLESGPAAGRAARAP